MFLLPISVLCLHKLSSPKEGIPHDVGLVQGHAAVWGRGEGWQPTLGLREEYRHIGGPSIIPQQPGNRTLPT